jgi:hypothetical protein
LAPHTPAPPAAVVVDLQADPFSDEGAVTEPGPGEEHEDEIQELEVLDGEFRAYEDEVRAQAKWYAIIAASLMVLAGLVAGLAVAATVWSVTAALVWLIAIAVPVAIQAVVSLARAPFVIFRTMGDLLRSRVIEKEIASALAQTGRADR